MAAATGSLSPSSSIANNGLLAFNRNNAVAQGVDFTSSAIAGTGSLTQLGPGALTLNGANSYTGTTTVVGGVLNINGGDSSAALVVNGGALYLNSSSPAPILTVAAGATLGGSGSLTSGTANVANGGILDFSQNTSGAFFTSGLTYAGSSTLKLGALANYTTSPFLNATALTTSGQINIAANLGSVSVLSGTYDLVSYGSIAGTGTSAFHLSSVAGLSNRQSAALLGGNSQIDLVINGQTPIWNGNQPDWLSTNAWTLQPSGSMTNFQTGDADIFDDIHNTGTFGGTVLLNSGNVAPGSVTFNNFTVAYTVSGNFGITGSGALGVQGGGSVTLLNSNSYTGGTSLINASQLTLGNGGATGSLSPSGAITLGPNSALNFSRSNSVVQGVDFSASGITGGGNVVQNGPGALIFTASNGYSGSTTISGGTLQLGTGASGQDGALTGNVINNSTLAYNLFGSQTAAYTSSGGGNVEKAGPGILTITTTQGYTGGTTVDAGTLQLNTGNGGNGALASPTITLNAGAFLALNAGDVIGYTTNLEALVINDGVVSNITAASRVTIQNAITMTGGTLTGAGAGDANGVYSFNSGNGFIATSDASGNPAVVNAAFSLQNGDLSINVTRGATTIGPDMIISSVIKEFGGNNYGINVQGNGILELTGVNTYTGTTTISGGVLQLGDNTTATHDGSINNTGAVINNSNLVFDIAGTQTAAYPISGNGSVSMTGTGMVVLSASNSYTGSTTVNAGKLYVNGALASVVTVNAGLFGGRGSSPGVSVATGGSIEGGFNGQGTLTLGLLSYAGSGSFTTNGYSNYPASSGTAAPLYVTGSSSLDTGTGHDLINLGGPPAVNSGIYHLIQYSGSILNSGFGGFTLGSVANNARGQLSFALVNDPNYVDVNVSLTPVIWTGSLSTAWNANDTLPAPKNWSYSGSVTNFQATDLVQFDNSTASGGTVAINNGNVLPGAISFNNDLGHAYTLTGTNGIAGTGQLVKNGAGSLTIITSNSNSGGTDLIAGTLNANATSALGTGAMTVNGGTLNSNFAEPVSSANLNGGLLVVNNNSGIGSGALTITGGSLDSTAGGIVLPNNTQNWLGDFTFLGSQSLSMGTGAVTMGSSRTVTVSGSTLTESGIISGAGLSLDKAGSGTLTLAAPNAYSGGTIVNGGTLNLAYGNGGVGTIHDGLTINPGATVVCTVNNALGYGTANIGGDWVQNITINRGALMTSIAGNDNGWGETISMTAGTVGTTVAGGYFSYGTYDATQPPTFNILASNVPSVISAGMQDRADSTNPGIVFNVTRGSAASDLNISGAIFSSGGASGIIVNGNGITVLTNTDTYTGATNINGGTLQLGNGQNGQDGTIASTSGVTDNAALVFDLAGTQTAAYAISGTGTLTMNGPGQLVLSGSANTYTGGTIVNNGELVATNAGAIQDGSNLYVGSPAGLASLGFPAPIVPTSPSAVAAPAVSPVPEPGTLSLLAAVGAAAASLIVRRKRRGGSEFGA